MSDEPRALEQIERWMQAVIMHPEGITAGIDSADARREIDVSASEVEDVVEPSRQLSSIDRLRVYGNAYYARLLECLREEFPALLHAVGEETFDALTFGYLQGCPSKSYTLAKLGARFPGYLAETRPAKDELTVGPDWPAFMIDLATLERTYSEVFDGPGVEGKNLLSVDDLLAIPPEQWEQVRLETVPCLRLLEFQFPVHEYATAVKQGKSVEMPDSRPTHLAISRRDYIVRRWELDAIEFQLLRLIESGETLGQAIENLADANSETGLPDNFADSLREWFAKWTASGFFAAVHGE